MQHRNLRPPSPLKYSDVFYGWPLILLPSVCILTFCIVFQSESSSSVTSTRLKMKKEMVACRCLARRQGITTIWISQHGWCIWITIRNSQWIMAENVDFCFADFTIKNIKTYQYVSKCRKWNWINCPIGSWIVQVQSIPFL